MWEAVKSIFFYIVKWLGLLAFSFMAMIMVQIFVTQTAGIWEKSDDQTVEEKYTHNGLYFAKRYYVKLSNGDTNSVFKHDFKSLKEGDHFDSFFPSMTWKDFWLIFSGQDSCLVYLYH